MSTPGVSSKSFDNFFYYGENSNSLDDEILHDLYQGIEQPKKSMYYNRQDGVGIHEKENFPSSIAFYIMCRYDIVQWIAYRNNNLPSSNLDRRVAASQASISVLQDPSSGEVDIKVEYIPFKDYTKKEALSLPMGKGA